MALYYCRHQVKDYDAWRPYFDADQPRIHSVGAKTVSVMRSTDDPNNVHFVFDIPDLEAFMGQMQSQELQDILQKAGVMEQPVFYGLEELQVPAL